ncbi:hypothetical protein D3C71_1807600 [compost metagenome]
MHQVVDEHRGFVEVGGEVMHAQLEKIRRVAITASDRRDGVLIDHLVERENTAVNLLGRVMQRVADLGAGS